MTADTFTPERRAAMDAERQAFSRDLFDGIARGLLAAAETQAEDLRRAGNWDDLRQLRLDGLRDVLAEAEDFDLRFLAETCHAFGFRMNFALADRKDGIRFTDTGREGGDGGP